MDRLPTSQDRVAQLAAPFIRDNPALAGLIQREVRSFVAGVDALIEEGRGKYDVTNEDVVEMWQETLASIRELTSPHKQASMAVSN